MFCPACGIHLAESSLIKRNAKLIEDVAVEYDARCPNCGIEVGRVSWGQLMIHPHLVKGELDDFDEKSASGGLIPPPLEPRTILRPMKKAGTAPSPSKTSKGKESASRKPAEQAPPVCPCCGQPWPEGKPYPPKTEAL